MGWPTIFIRTSGCHLRCNYCDTTYAYYEGSVKNIQNILDEIQQYPSKKVCITGGEPLLQKGIYSLMEALLQDHYEISLETSGDIECHQVPLAVKKIIDIKTPDSGVLGAFKESNLDFKNDPETEYKFVICSEKDTEWALSFVKLHGLAKKSQVFFSPNHGKIALNWLADQILQNNSKVRLQLQLHKYIWSEHERGV